MSYPRSIQALIVEDEPKPKLYYDAVFDNLVKKGLPIEPPHFAFSFEEGRAALTKDTIFHLVVLDLRLPEKPGEPPPDSVSYGLELLDLCIARCDFPIPAILVVSGHLDQANQGELEAKLRENFVCGHVLMKGTRLDPDIEKAIVSVLNYCDVGIHLRDGGSERFPTLSPREEDLLRRAVLDSGISSAIDLRWWANEYSPPRKSRDPYTGWTKTLMGTFILNKGRGRSRPVFFKFTPASGADAVATEAQVLAAKLPHIKVCGSWNAGDRSLLATEKVGDSDNVPISLMDFMGRPPQNVAPYLSGIVNDVATQLARLGEIRPNQLPVGQLLWKWHDIENLTVQWNRWNKAHFLTQNKPATDPVALLASLQRSTQVVRVSWASALHGDLNVTNVALDTDNGVKGYIFDASGLTPGADVRDLAMLEVSAMLHQTAAEDLGVLTNCAQLYGLKTSDLIHISERVGTQAQNTFALITAIRDLPVIREHFPIYALMVFDHAMIQLGGLGHTVSCNKIRRPEDAAALAALVTQWVYSQAPDICANLTVLP